MPVAILGWIRLRGPTLEVFILNLVFIPLCLCLHTNLDIETIVLVYPQRESSMLHAGLKH